MKVGLTVFIQSFIKIIFNKILPIRFANMK